ncbi:MAG: hypothetical protein ACK41Q_14710, partial [Candidatus Brocadia sp.]
MTSFLYEKKIRIFDYPQFAQSLRDELIAHAKQKIPYTMCDNAFLDIGDFKKAQEIANGFSPEQLHSILNEFSQKYCPFLKKFHLSYHWSIMQIEYATDIVFKQQSYLQSMYDTLTRTAIHTVKPENIATFLGKKLHGNLDKISKNVTEKNHTYKGFNFFNDDDQQIFLTIARGEFNIRGFQNKNLRVKLKEKTTSQICRIIKRLRVHGLIRKITHSYKYHLTTLGRKVIALGLKLKELVIIPQLAVQ